MSDILTGLIRRVQAIEDYLWKKKTFPSSTGAASAGGAEDPFWHVDGALAVLTQVGESFVSPRTLVISAVYIYAETLGASSSTIVDVNKNGVTIFTTQASRPTLAFNDADKVAKSAAPDVTGVSEGDVLTVDIDQVAPGARGLTVIVAMTPGSPASALPRNVVFTVNRILVPGANPLRFYNNMMSNQVLTKVHLAVNVAPTGQAIIVDIHKNGTTIFTNQANRPQIASGQYTGQSTTIDIPGWVTGEYLTMEIDQVGSTVNGGYLVVTLSLS